MTETVTQSAMDGLSQNFRHFAEVECKGSSPLYEHLSFSIASDEDILRLAAQVPQGQPVPNLLLGAVHYLLYEQPGHELAKYYPSLTNSPQPTDDAFPYFRHFCLSKRTNIVDLIHTRRVQTNEVRRCAYLFPAFSHVFELAKGIPLSLIEIGTSAGLNLMWDYYQYDYEIGAFSGRLNALVTIRSSFRGDKRPHLPVSLPTVQERIGIDLNIIDVREPKDALWLKALIWPEHKERATVLTTAIDVVQTYPPTLLAGDGIVVLPEIMGKLPSDTAACVFHTHTLNQVPSEVRLQLTNLLTEFSKQRTIYQIGCEWIGSPYSQLTLNLYRSGQRTETVLAYCDGHARWIEWLDS